MKHIFLQRWIDKLAQTQHNLQELRIKNDFPFTEGNFNVVELCRNNNNIKVLVFKGIVISQESCRAISDNFRKLEELAITFPKSEQTTYERYFINFLFWQ